MSLSSLIVQREIASIREIEEALARQVLYGGDFVTNLFEVSRIEEAVLMPVVAELYGLPAVPPGELPKAPPEAVRLVAAEVVGERAFAPLELGRSLVVAVAEPLSRDVEQELTFALALPIEQRIAPLFRIRQALARDYGLGIDKRTARLITKIINKGPRIASTIPPPLESSPHHRAPPRPPSKAPSPPVRSGVPSTSTTIQGTFVRSMEAPALRPIRRRRGPLTAEIARAELEASAERDVIFDILFEFARQFFDYTALFVVHGDLAEGRDAFGDGALREKVARIGVPLDLRNILARAREEKKLVRTRPSNEEFDRVLMADLGREGATECVVFPTIVRTRVVALLFGDGGLSGIDDIGVRQVEDLVEAASGAFERVIMRRKLRGSDAAERGGAGVDKKKDAEPLALQATLVSLGSAMPPRSEDASDAAMEELAPPIRELMAEPASRAATTTREPTAVAKTLTAVAKTLTTANPMAARSDGPPPANLLTVKRPSGRPIPREEPESAVVAAVPPAVLPPVRTKSQALKRAEAPRLEFGTPSVPSVVTEGASWGFTPPTPDDGVELQLMAQIHGPGHGTGPTGPTGTTRTHETSGGGGAMPYSPRAESPPRVRAAPAPSHSAQNASEASGVGWTTTLVAGSPLLPMLEPKVDENPKPITPLVVVTPDQEIAPVPLDGTMDPEATPVVPPVFDPDLEPTPLAGAVAVTHGSAASDPVLALAQRKGAPPVLPVMPDAKPMPMSEQQISVPAHRPPSSRNDHSRALPSVIVDVSSEYHTLVERVLAGADEDAETALLRAGVHAMPAIMAKFPGPIALEAERLETGQLPRVADCGPVIRLIASQRRTALPFVLTHIEGADVEARFWATYLLTELVYTDAIDAAISRNFDDDARVRRAARAACRALAEAHPQMVIGRLGEIATASTQSVPRRIQAIEALGETREPIAVPVILPLLEESTEDVINAARAALVIITQQDFNRETDKWAQWWRDHGHRHRLEWLIDSLMHDQRALRGSASDELRTITKEFFGYHDDLPKRERERAQARYREWWETIGRIRFSRAATRGA